MTTPFNEAPAAPDLQFDSAERRATAAGQGACAICAKPIGSVYHVMNQSAICSACRAQVEKMRSTGASRLPLALVAGAVAAVLGAILYVGVVLITGYEIGLIAIAVGWLVGKAVSKASGGAGGPAYQWTALAFTYLAILPIYVLPALAEGKVRGIDSILLLPFTQGLENVIGVVILGVGLYQAWIMNRKSDITLSGPFEVKQAAAGEGAVAGV